MELNETQKAILAEVEAAMSGQAPEAPKERLRAMTQGLTFGGADEAEAFVRSLLGEDYATVREDVRKKLREYHKNYPKSALGYEALGSLPTMLIPGMNIAKGAKLGQMALQGGKAGALTGFGTGEGGVGERLARMPGGAATGAILAPLIGGALNVAAKPFSALIDATRRTLGNRGSTAVEAEVQRLAQLTGRTTDEIVQDIADGRILAENKTLRAAVRDLYIKQSPAKPIIEESLSRRPGETTTAAVGKMQSDLSTGADPNLLRAVQQTKEAQRLAREAKYAPFEGQDASADLIAEVFDAVQRVPSALKEIDVIAQTQKVRPAFKIDANGRVLMTRAPTVMEAERILRAIKTRTNALYGQENMGGAGGEVKKVGQSLQASIDELSPELGKVRAGVKMEETASEAFDAGTKVLTSPSPDKLQIDLDKIIGDPAQMEMFRSGFMSTLRKMMGTGSRTTLLRTLQDDTTNYGRIFRMIYPADKVDDALKQLDIAGRSGETANFVRLGSATNEGNFAAAKSGSTMSMGEIAAAFNPLANPDAAISVTKKVISSFKTEQRLTDKDMTRIAEILVSENPDVVRRALSDESGMAKLQSIVARTASILANIPRRVATTTPVIQPGADLTSQIGQGLFGQFPSADGTTPGKMRIVLTNPGNQ